MFDTVTAPLSNSTTIAHAGGRYLVSGKLAIHLVSPLARSVDRTGRDSAELPDELEERGTRGQSLPVAAIGGSRSRSIGGSTGCVGLLRPPSRG
jgi:hypothetical protein